MTPDEEERLRQRLRGARVDEPMPDDVATRIEDTLTGVATGDTEGARAAPDVPRVDRRRRQVATGLLAAAVAAVVIGVGLAQLLGGGQGGPVQDSAESAQAGETRPDTGADPEREADGGSPSDLPQPDARRRDRPQDVDVPRIYLLQPDRFRADVRRVRTEVLSMALDSVPRRDQGTRDNTAPGSPGAAQEDTSSGAAGRLNLNALLPCGPKPGPADVRVRVRYNGRPGVLLLRPAQGGPQRVDLYLCSSRAAGNGALRNEPEGGGNADRGRQSQPDRTVRLPAP